MGKTWSNDEWLMVLEECKKGAKRMANKLELRRCEIGELEGQLVEDVFKDISRKKDGEILNLLAFVRYSIKQRSTDYLRNNRSRINYETSSFSDREKKDSNNEDMSTIERDIHKAQLGQTDFTKQYIMKEQIEKLRSHLSESDNRIFELLFIKEMKSKEICELIGCSINTPRNVQKRVQEIAKNLDLKI